MNPYEKLPPQRQDLLTGRETIDMLIRRGWRAYKRTRKHYQSNYSREYYISLKYPKLVFVHKALENYTDPYFHLAKQYK